MKTLASVLIALVVLVTGCKSGPRYTGKADFDLGLAAMTGDIGKMDQLLDSGVNIEAASSRGWTALHCAAENGANESVKELIRRGAKIDAQTVTGATPLTLAITSGRQDTAKLLIKLGARTDIADANGVTAEGYASRLGISLK